MALPSIVSAPAGRPQFKLWGFWGGLCRVPRCSSSRVSPGKWGRPVMAAGDLWRPSGHPARQHSTLATALMHWSNALQARRPAIRDRQFVSSCQQQRQGPRCPRPQAQPQRSGQASTGTGELSARSVNRLKPNCAARGRWAAARALLLGGAVRGGERRPAVRRPGR